LVAGTLGVTFIYLLINGAFLKALGSSGVTSSNAVATDAVASAFPDFGERVIAMLICISALGAVNELIFTGALISNAVGQDHRLLRNLGEWDRGGGRLPRPFYSRGFWRSFLLLHWGLL
jgi:APA family basic amino acid/polyamine antiporter